ncbi:MAG: cytochrome c [Verrucomicrobiales bacterium]|nr:cytochrome c [Verrucomicrobiales bacterium]
MALFLLGVAVASVQGANGDAIFLKHCALCHGKDGKAQNPAARKLGVKDLSESKATDAEIVKQVTEGKKDDRGNLKMPGFREKLTGEEIQSLVVLVKRFRR